jgi:diguanylate cyclase (GGDEF)-like protein
LYTDESLIRGLHEFLINPDSEETFKKEVTELRRGENRLFLNLRFQKVRNYHCNIIGYLGITRDITETMKLESRLRELSVTDEMTGLYNQREFFNLLEREVEKYKRNSRDLSLCFIDLDKFKQFNDQQGHLEGDQALKKVAEFMKKSVRHHLDLVFRYGGDEFAIIMSEVSPEKGRVIAERIRVAVQNYYRGRITLSIGIVGYNSRQNAQQFVESADNAMYHAKSRGGNRIALI